VSLPPLTPSQSLRLLMDNDARNLRDIRKPWGIFDSATHAKVIADCARRLFDARTQDAIIGGQELERRAEANLRAALDGWRA
jgi:hypothetical protein